MGKVTNALRTLGQKMTGNTIVSNRVDRIINEIADGYTGGGGNPVVVSATQPEEYNQPTLIVYKDDRGSYRNMTLDEFRALPDTVMIKYENLFGDMNMSIMAIAKLDSDFDNIHSFIGINPMGEGVMSFGIQQGPR